MNDTKKFTNLASAKIFEFGYNRNIDSKKFEYINVNNKITNFNINFVNKPKIEYQIESKSFEYSDSKFSVQKINDMILDHSKFSIIDDKKNKTFNCSVKKFKKIENYPSKSLTYNKIIEDTPKINLESSRTIKLKSQKREDSIFTTINKKNNILSNEDNNIKSSLKAINENHSDPTNISLNLDLLKNININHETKDENEFYNSINKSTILKVNFHSSDKNNNLPQTFDERGFLYNSNATYFDNDGDFFNEEGFDKNKGRHNRLGEYQPGPNFNNELGMYNDDINNLSFDKATLKNELDEKEDVEFQKIVLEGKESNKLTKDFQFPIEKNDSSDDLNISEEFLKLEKSAEFVTDNDEIEDFKTKENKPKDKIITKFNNNALNKELEKIIKENEDKDKNKNEIKNEIIETNNNVSKDKKGINKNNKRKSKNVKRQKYKRKKKSKNSPNIQNKDNATEENKNYKKINKTNQTKFKKPFSHSPEITEESINRESNFDDYDSYFEVKKIFNDFGLDNYAQQHEFILEIANLINNCKRIYEKK